MKMIIEIGQNFKLRQTRQAIFMLSSSIQSAPNTKPIGLYPAHLWAPGRGEGEEGERVNRGGKILRGRRVMGPQGE
jgi:hypothetical protein